MCPPIPDPPQLASSSVQSLTLNWPKQPEASSYVLQMDDTTSGYGFMAVYNGPDLTHTKKDLKRVTKYKFRVIIFHDSLLWSSTSLEATFNLHTLQAYAGVDEHIFSKSI